MSKITFFITLFLLVSTVMLAQVTSLSGTGTAADPYLIGTPDELKFLSQQVNLSTNTSEETTSEYQKAGKVFKLTADLDMSEGLWSPIGTANNNAFKYFRGIFDGNGYKISNLMVGDAGTRSGATNVGLFGTAGGNAIIKNVIIEGASFYLQNSYTAAILVGNTINVTIVNCHVSGTMDIAHTTGTSALYFYAGINGLNKNCGVINSSADIVLDVVHDKAVAYTLVCGGLVGRIDKPASGKTSAVVNCYSSGAINVKAYNTTIKPTFYAGGLVGQFVAGFSPEYFITAANNVSSCSVEVEDNTQDGTGTRWIGGISADVRDYNVLTDVISLCPKLSYTGTAPNNYRVFRIAAAKNASSVFNNNYSGVVAATPEIDLSTEIGHDTRNGANLDSQNPVTLLNTYVNSNSSVTYAGNSYNLRSWKAGTPTPVFEALTSGIASTVKSANSTVYKNEMNQLVVKVSETTFQRATVKVYSLNGQLQQMAEFNSNEYVMNKNIGKGIFLVTVSVDNTTTTHKVSLR